MSKSVDVEVANIKEAMTGLNNEKVITPYSLNQVIKRKAGGPGGSINNFVSYDSQFKNDNQKLQARTNIHAMSDWIDLGVIDLDEYDGDIYNFMNTLVNTGNYIFKDNSDYFTFNLQVQSSLEETSFVLQKYWTTEEGLEYIRFGTGDDINSLYWNERGSYLTFSDASNMYAQKTHQHYTNVYTDNLEEWFENLTIENSGGQPYSQFIVVYNNELYIVNQYYDNRLVNGVQIRNRSQSYYKENEPWIVYSRYGRARNYSPYQIDWQNWNISISERQDGEQSNLENYEDNLKTKGKYKCNDGSYIYKYDVNVNDIGGYIYQKKYTYGDDASYEEAIRYYDGNSWSQWTGGVPAVVDNLTSTSSTNALSANQGKVLKDSFDGLEDLFKVVSYTFSSGTQSAGAKGNYSFSITIPTGYTSFVAQVNSGQVANLGGAQYTPAYGHIGTTGTQTVYVWYYYPTAVETARNVEYKLICIKTAYYNEV